MKNIALGAIIIFVVLTGVLVGYSLLIGWSTISMILFWFGITPAIAYFIPGLILKEGNFLQASIVGLAMFYSGMVFMIYSHFESDYFQLMLVSLAVNVSLISIVHRIKSRKTISKS